MACGVNDLGGGFRTCFTLSESPAWSIVEFWCYMSHPLGAFCIESRENKILHACVLLEHSGWCGFTMRGLSTQEGLPQSSVGQHTEWQVCSGLLAAAAIVLCKKSFKNLIQFHHKSVFRSTVTIAKCIVMLSLIQFNHKSVSRSTEIVARRIVTPTWHAAARLNGGLFAWILQCRVIENM